MLIVEVLPMNLLHAIEISASGLAVQRARMDVIAENLANASTTRAPGGGPYRRKRVIVAAGTAWQVPFALPDILNSRNSCQGVRVLRIEDDMSTLPLVFDPGNPDAGPDGYVQMPNVNPVVELVDMISATRAYEANAAVVSAIKEMAYKALSIAR